MTETSSRYEGTSFESDTFRVAVEGTFPAEKSRTATIQIGAGPPRDLDRTRMPEKPSTGHVGDEREKALYVDEMRRRRSGIALCRSD